MFFNFITSIQQTFVDFTYIDLIHVSQNYYRMPRIYSILDEVCIDMTCEVRNSVLLEVCIFLLECCPNIAMVIVLSMKELSENATL